MKQIENDAQDELDYIREKVRHEIEATKQGGFMSEENRKM